MSEKFGDEGDTPLHAERQRQNAIAIAITDERRTKHRSNNWQLLQGKDLESRYNIQINTLQA